MPQHSEVLGTFQCYPTHTHTLTHTTHTHTHTHTHTTHTHTHTLTSTRAVQRGRNSRQLPFLLVTHTLHLPGEWLLAGHGQNKESLAADKIACNSAPSNSPPSNSAPSNSAPSVWHLLEDQTVSHLTVILSQTSPGRLR